MNPLPHPKLIETAGKLAGHIHALGLEMRTEHTSEHHMLFRIPMYQEDGTEHPNNAVIRKFATRGGQPYDDILHDQLEAQMPDELDPFKGTKIKDRDKMPYKVAVMEGRLTRVPFGKDTVANVPEHIVISVAKALHDSPSEYQKTLKSL